VIEEKDKTIIHLKLTEEQEQQVIQDIETELARIQQERDENDLEEKWQEELNLYEGVVEPKDFPWEDCANYHIPITAYHVDVITIKSKKHTLSAKPIILLESEIDVEQNLRNREDFIDFKLRKEVGIEDLISTVYRYAVIQGTSWVKVPIDKRLEPICYMEEYKPIPEDIQRYKFESRFRPESERQKNLEKLLNGESIYVRVDTYQELYFAPKPYRVPIEDLYVRPSIKDLLSQRLIAEKLKFTWNDIQYRIDIGYYDKDKIEKIKQEKGEKYFEGDYTFYECILYSDIEKKGQFKRYVFTIEDSTRTIVRAILYPYKHGKIYYVPYYAIPRDDSIYGYSIPEKIKDLNKIINNLWNSTFDIISMHVNPPKQVSDKNIDLNSINWGPGAIVPTLKGLDTFRLLIPDLRGTDAMNLIPLAERFTEFASGVSAGMSGQETLLDPRSPASKTAMLLRESNIRIEDIIKELQKGNSKLAEQIEKLYWQYKPEEFQGKNINPDVKVRYIPHGLSLEVNKEMELSALINFMSTILPLFPEIAQNPEARKIIIEAYIDALGGTIEKKKDKLLAPLKQLQGQNQNQLQQQIDAITEELIQQGASPEEVQEAINELMQEQGQET